MITSIGQLLEQMGVTSRIFDLGRHIQEISTATFAEFEAQAVAYPAPYLHHAWIGLLFWDPDTPDIPLLWFIKLPLDEQGKIVPAQRDQFLQQLLVALGSNIEASKQGEQLAAVLEGNPYVFTPTPERQAAIHARVNLLLNNPPSDFYAATCDYLNSNLEAWHQLGIQGLADVAVRWPEHQQTLIQAIASMPPAPLIGLCQCLENEAINGAVGKALHSRLLSSLTNFNTEDGLETANSETPLCAALVRGLSQCRALELRQKALTQLLASPAINHIEVLAAIATRCAQDLCNPEICLPFLEALCLHGQQNFNRILADLLFCAAIRPHILAAFRQQQRSVELSIAIGGLLNPQTPPADPPPPATLH
ncbi:DUF3549 family protein [Aestuariicella hydrocarbonica]|uniref:DUF3549 family protein n=1 Tax=Pseudomaricurvus hydrocarbonicus TaxID=1470433 RepID=A0A9E5MLB1_9GAMM|nr:DUF3549 family protein [Aestuariicella hydrocarbonica]NHO64178.1 DUF3549 family protein [Aestuariicella hydrocarbonica]